MDKYKAKRECYFMGKFLKKDETFYVPKDTKVTFTLVEKVEEPKVIETEKKTKK